MKLINGLNSIEDRHRGQVLTIGNFDGVHTGHQKIIKTANELAKRHGLKSMAMTFEPHPTRLFAPEKAPKLLMPVSEKVRIMTGLGLDYVLVVDFTKEFAHLDADEFIKEILVGALNVRAIVVGHNYSFGRGRKGNTSLLRRRGARYGFGLTVVRSAKVGGDIVSSSRIRSLLYWGRVCEAAIYLGRPYEIKGTVVKGAGRGARLLGTPTANIETQYEIMPRSGVYAANAVIEGKTYDAVANIGNNPTFCCSAETLEVHVFGMDKDLLGKTVTVYFIDRIREEKTFKDAQALKGQIHADIDKSREILHRKGLRSGQIRGFLL